MNILITCPRFESHIQPLETKLEECNIEYKLTFKVPSDQFFTESELINLGSEFTHVVVGDDIVDKEFIDKNINLQHLIKWGSGTDSINKEYLRERKVKFNNSPENLHIDVAEHAIALILNTLKEINKIDRKIKTGDWYKPTTQRLYGKKIGVIGYGKIGRQLVNILNAFNVSITIYDPNITNAIDTQVKIADSVDDLLIESNIIIVCASLNDSTINLLNINNLKLVQEGSFLINVSRGKIIDESSLVVLSKEGKLKGLGLDVFIHEPPDSNSDIFDLENTVFTSHNASSTLQANNEVNKKIIELLIGEFNG